MREIWCLEDEKIERKILTGILAFFFLKIKWRERREFKGGERRDKMGQSGEATSPQAVGGAWTSRGQRAPLAVGPTVSLTAWAKWPHGHPLLSRAPSVLQPYLGHPNSDFKSVFRLQTVTLLRTTMTTQFWKMLEKSSRKMTMKTTQRMRTKSYVATSFGLETLWMSNRNDRNSIRYQIRTCSSPSTKIRKHTSTNTHTYANF